MVHRDIEIDHRVFIFNFCDLWRNTLWQLYLKIFQGLRAVGHSPCTVSKEWEIKT